MKHHQGFTIVELMIVVATIGLLAAIAIPAYSQARNNSISKGCINNLRQIDGAKDEYALDHNNQAPADWGDLVSTYITKTPACKGGGAYAFNALGAAPTCDVGAGHEM